MKTIATSHEGVPFLEIFPGWNYTAQLYRAQKAVLDGTWIFPEAKPANSFKQ